MSASVYSNSYFTITMETSDAQKDFFLLLHSNVHCASCSPSPTTRSFMLQYGNDIENYFMTARDLLIAHPLLHSGRKQFNKYDNFVVSKYIFWKLSCRH